MYQSVIAQIAVSDVDQVCFNYCSVAHEEKETIDFLPVHHGLATMSNSLPSLVLLFRARTRHRIKLETTNKP